MTGKIKLLEPDIGDKAVDHRGAIFSYVPKDAIVEFVYVYSKPTGVRGKHYHKHFDEYIMMVDGEGIYFEPPNGPTVLQQAAPEGYFQSRITVDFQVVEQL